jgi:type II secretory pathway pseudopilin PulG
VIAGRAQQGFALLDTIIALGIIGVIAALFAQVVQSSALARHNAAQRRAAVMVAQSQLAQLAEGAVEPRAGRSDDLLWRNEVSSYPGVPNGPGLERLSVTVSDPASGRALIRLETLRLAR